MRNVGRHLRRDVVVFVSKLAGRLRDDPMLALMGLGGFKEAYEYLEVMVG